VESDDSESNIDDEDTNVVKAPVPPKRPGPPQGAPGRMAGMAAALKAGREGLRKVESDDSESDTDGEDANGVKTSIPTKRPCSPKKVPPRRMARMVAFVESRRPPMHVEKI